MSFVSEPNFVSGLEMFRREEKNSSKSGKQRIIQNSSFLKNAANFCSNGSLSVSPLSM